MPLHVSTRADDADKHASDVNALVYAKGRLYSGADDGKIKIWEEDLKFVGERQAHESSIFSLAASNDTLYSCSNDGSIRAWDLATLSPKGNVAIGQDEFWKLRFVNGLLYSGDDQGGLRVYKNNKLIGEDNTCDGIKDLAVSGDTIFTVKDLDVTVTEFKTTESKFLPTTKKTLVGRAPIVAIGNTLTFTSRSGKDILVHEISDESHYKQITELKDAHELIINALAGETSGSSILLYTGGWDRLVKQWKLENGTLSPVEKVSVDIVVNTLIHGEKGEIYAAGSDGHIVRVDV